MKVRRLGLSAIVFAVACAACKGGSGASSPPTAPSASATCSPAVVTICSSGGPNDGRPAFGQVTVAAGGAPSCRVAINEAIPITFTIVNPNSSATWEIFTNTHQAASPSSGSAGSAGPFQATVQFTTFGGDNITDDTIHMGLGTGALSCDFKIYGHN